jgi:glutathione S-transferase
MTPRLTLVSHHLCPYVQRAAIALIEKGVPFERIAVDLADKPDWFRALSPLGKVPLLKVSGSDGEHVIFESAVILEYLEETQLNPLHPVNPLARARHRGWMEFGSAILNGISKFYSSGTDAGFLAEAGALSAMFGRIEAELAARPSGPWFGGERFSLVDAVFGPMFRYFDTFDQIGDFGILDRKPLVAAWRESLAKRPSVAAAVAADYPDRLLAFLTAKETRLAEIIRARHAASYPSSRAA